ncbi:MAG TPA: hypothetical protein VMT85_21255 [Thermoanaerobaculia bacterium]|nr:hypothetical protein [Thermoanaerobaculia bacterium]
MPLRILAAIASLLCLSTLAAGAEGYEPPRTAEGRPLLDGVWTNASLTQLTRPRGLDELVLTAAEAEALAAKHFHNVRAAADLEPSDPDREAKAVDRLPPVGNYNAFWVDPGTEYAVVEGEIRTSWIVEPEDGQVPLRQEVRERRGERRALREGMDGPEVLSLGERCLLGFGGTAGPPMLNVLYNGYYRIVQTDSHVMILVEMVHDARIIRLASDHGPPEDRRWLGDSIGWWEGDTLVVETTSFHPSRDGEGGLPYSSLAEVVERITRVSDDTLLYEFEIEDPLTYSAPIRGQMTFRAVEAGRVYEYACHEGNYAMGGMLRGARLAEREAGADP